MSREHLHDVATHMTAYMEWVLKSGHAQFNLDPDACQTALTALRQYSSDIFHGLENPAIKSVTAEGGMTNG